MLWGQNLQIMALTLSVVCLLPIVLRIPATIDLVPPDNRNQRRPTISRRLKQCPSKKRRKRWNEQSQEEAEKGGGDLTPDSQY